MTVSKSPSWQWIAGILITVLALVISGVYATIRSDVSDNCQQIRIQADRNGVQDVSIGRMQSDINYIRDGVDDIKHSLRNR